MITRLILAVVIPPVSVFLGEGVSQALIINIVLTLLGWVPGIVHAIWIINKESEKVDV